ncbi:retrovirus-related pol polyprotein from transposon TNT 1-94 [Tanacetum coccineum]
MASSATTAPAIPVFSGTHYHIWAVKMKTYLKSQGLWKVVETDESIPALGENPTVAQLRTYETESLKKDKALTCLHSGIADQIFTSIMDLETPKAVWDKLQETFEGTDRVKAVRLLTLKREFELLRMKDDELVKDYSARMINVVNQMRLHGEVMKDHKVVEKMIMFPPKCEAKISAIEESCDLEYAVKKAHNNTQGVQQANVSEEDQVDDEHLFMASHLDKHPNSLTWLMDSGCTSHMTLEKSFFISLDTKDNPRVKLGDGRYTRAKGRGTIAINTKKGTKYISRVLYVPELERNMLSVPQMIKNGYGVNFKKDSQCVITDSHDSKIAILDMVNYSYYLKLDVANASAFSVTEDDSMKWDKRNGHFNYRTLKHMNTTKLVRDMPPISEVDISEFDIEDVTDTDVLRTRPLVDVYESCNSVIEPKSYMDASKLGSGIFCWNSKKQSVVAQSSAEAEYISVAGAVNHAIWIQKLLSDLDLTQEEAEKNEEVKLKYCISETQLADMLTKSITGKKLNYFKARLMESNNNLKEEQQDRAETLAQQQAATFQLQFDALRAELQAYLGQIQGRHGGGGDQGTLLSRSMRLDVPKFSSVGPDSWIFAITEYFSLLNTPVDQRLRIDRFVESVKSRFGPSKYKDPQWALSKLLQLGTVEDYQREFEKLMNRVTNIPKSLLISFYIFGLKLHLQRELLVSKPTTLGDAFALDRITEARLEGQTAALTGTTAKTVAAVTPQRQSVPRFGGVSRTANTTKPPLLPLAIKWISPAERQERLNKGLCFNYDNWWTRGHKCPGYATMAAPLMELLLKDGFRWVGQEAAAFQELKQQLSIAPILSLPNFTQEFVVEADASDYGIWAVLLQYNRLINYFFRKLGPRMRAAATYQKELFAIVEVVYKWRQYLVGRRFKIRTDHKSIKELMQQVIQTPIQQKYVWKLMGFDFVVEYKPRVANQVADALSRMYEDGELVKAEFMAISHPIVRLLENLKSGNETLKGLQAVGGYLQPLPMPEGVCEDVSMDFITELPLSKGFTAILVVVDRFSKYAHFGALPTNFKGHKVRLLPWAEYCYNTSYHSSIKMSPYQALYGRLPLSLIPYPPGASKVIAVVELLMERNKVTRQLKQNLLAAKLRMEEKANHKRRDVEFKVGDKVPYEIAERIEKVAYRLALPVTSKIHPVFHVSILKLFTGTSSKMNGKYERQVLVQWVGQSPEEATWEWLTDFQSAYPTCNLKDKVVSEDGGNVLPLVGRLGRGKRAKKAQKWQKSFAMG